MPLNPTICAMGTLVFWVAVLAEMAPAYARSLGTAELQEDTRNTIILQALVQKWAGWPEDCEDASVDDVIVLQNPTSVTSGWKERWSMLACGAKVDIDVSYAPAPDGGTLIRTNVAQQPSTEEVSASEGQGSSLVGLWTGTVVQVDVGEFKVWLTFVSQTSGVSQYPAHKCGGVLSGEMVGESIYKFSEKIAWGREEGCIDGEMQLTVRGEELELEFSAVHEGKQEKASGTLRRFEATSAE